MTDTHIKTKYAEVIRLKIVDGGSRGSLQVAEVGKNIPFLVRRTMIMWGVEGNESRGGHGHKTFDQVIVPVRGSFVLGLDDGETTQEILMNDPSIGIRLMPKLWHTMKDFSPDAVVFVLCADEHDEADYLRDYDEWKNYLRANPD